MDDCHSCYITKWGEKKTYTQLLSLLPPCDLHIFKLMVMFILCSTMGEPRQWGPFPKYEPGLSYRLILGPPTLGPYTTYHTFIMKIF